MKELQSIKKEVQELSDIAHKTIERISENGALDVKRKNIQRGKIVAYEHVLTIIDKHLNSK